MSLTGLLLGYCMAGRSKRNWGRGTGIFLLCSSARLTVFKHVFQTCVFVYSIPPSHDALALQENNSIPGECSISNHNEHHSKAFCANRRSKALFDARPSLQEIRSEHDSLWTDIAENAAVIVRLREEDTTAVSVYVRPAVVQDPDTFRKIRHSWGRMNDEARGQALFNLLPQLNLIIINYESRTIVHQSTKPSPMNFTVAFCASQVSWNVGPDTWDSDDLPIHLTSSQRTPKPSR